MTASLSKACRHILTNYLSTLTLLFAFSSQVIASETLVLAVDESPPYSFQKNGKASGLLIELATSLANKSNLELDIVFCPWARCLELTHSGQADILLGLTKSVQREQMYTFIEPERFVTTYPFSFYYVKPEMAINSEFDLAHRLIGVTRGSHYYPEFDHNPEYKKVELNDVSVQIKMLKQGRIDTFIYLAGVVEPYLTQHDKAQEIKVSSYQAYNKVKGYLVLSKKSAIPKSVLENAMTELKATNYIPTLFAKYGIKH